jgi:hypothetical protein
MQVRPWQDPGTLSIPQLLIIDLVRYWLDVGQV